MTLECAAILPNSEADDVVRHIEAVWNRGKIAIDALRNALGVDLQDVLCPLRNGGVSLHKMLWFRNSGEFGIHNETLH